ncbi:hypothetical protein HOLleu_42779 [Holothuria leucospilota]|uniref:Uncharacterized protein n=1 Tax=Holothuria leucospilota TaxID=206669 RepID=A0A9Q0YCD8_HOLLE|nr:hypothetical protein HOLleu_42779 [Holothuria leucospilota]
MFAAVEIRTYEINSSRPCDKRDVCQRVGKQEILVARTIVFGIRRNELAKKKVDENTHVGDRKNNSLSVSMITASSSVREKSGETIMWRLDPLRYSNCSGLP